MSKNIFDYYLENLSCKLEDEELEPVKTTGNVEVMDEEETTDDVEIMLKGKTTSPNTTAAFLSPPLKRIIESVSSPNKAANQTQQDNESQLEIGS